MVAEVRRCAECGSPLRAEHRLVRARGGAWTAATVALRCDNSRCRARYVRGALSPAPKDRQGPELLA